MPSIESFYTAEQVAQLLQVSDQAVYNLIKKGKLKAVKVGRAYRFSDVEVKRFLGLEDQLKAPAEPTVPPPTPTVSATQDQPTLGNVKKEELPIVVLKEPAESTFEAPRRRNFATRYTWEAAVLRCLGHVLVDAEYISNMNRFMWHFEDTELLRQDLAEHWAGRLEVNSKDMWEAWKYIKDYMNAQNK